MIKYNGYYILDPIPVNDSIANYSFRGYNHHAYLFFKNGTYLRASKLTKDKIIFFSKEDFDCNYPNRYMLNNGDLILTYHTGEEWEFSEIFKRHSADRFEKEGKSLKFVKWETHPV